MAHTPIIGSGITGVALFQATEISFARHTLANRPVPGDGLPAAGPGCLPGLRVAVMHSGATLAPSVAAMLTAMLADEMQSGLVSPLLAPFRPARFSL